MTDSGSFIFAHACVKQFGTKDHSIRNFTTDQL